MTVPGRATELCRLVEASNSCDVRRFAMDFLGDLLPFGAGPGEGAAKQGEQGEQGECEEVELLAHGAESWCQQVGAKNRRACAFDAFLIH